MATEETPPPPGAAADDPARLGPLQHAEACDAGSVMGFVWLSDGGGLRRRRYRPPSLSIAEFGRLASRHPCRTCAVHSVPHLYEKTFVTHAREIASVDADFGEVLRSNLTFIQSQGDRYLSNCGPRSTRETYALRSIALALP